MSASLSSASPSHHHEHGDGDACCASTASAASPSSPLTDAPLDTLVPPPSSLFSSYITAADLPSYAMPVLGPQPKPQQQDPYHGQRAPAMAAATLAPVARARM